MCVGSSFWSRYGILRSCLAGQMCRISIVDQSQGAVDEKAGSSLGHFAEVVFRLPVKHP